MWDSLVRYKCKVCNTYHTKDEKCNNAALEDYIEEETINLGIPGEFVVKHLTKSELNIILGEHYHKAIILKSVTTNIGGKKREVMINDDFFITIEKAGRDNND